MLNSVEELCHYILLSNVNFPLQVIEYVQYLQEKVQKYEVSYQDWSAEPTKLMPWVKF